MQHKRSISLTVQLILAVLLLTGAVIRYAYYQERKNQPDFSSPLSDAHFHDYWARALASGDWTPPEDFPDPQIQSSPYFRPPGYPFFLSGIYKLFSTPYQAAMLVQCVLGVLSAWMAFFIGRRWFGNLTGLLWAAFMATYWSFIFFEGELLEPPLLIVLTLVFLWAVSRWIVQPGWWNGLFAGGVIGLAVLTRPNMLAAAAGVFLYMLFVTVRKSMLRRNNLLAAAGFIFGVAAIVSVSAVRNYRASGDWVLVTSNAGINLYIGNNPAANGEFSEPPEIAPFGSVYEVPRLVTRLEEQKGRDLSHSDVSRYFSKLATTWIMENPGGFARLLGRKFLLFWGPSIIGNNKADHFERLYSPVLSRLPSSFPLFLSLAFAGLLFVLRKPPSARGGAQQTFMELHVSVRTFVGVTAAFVFFGFLSYWPFFPTERYRLAWMPILLMYAACGVSSIIYLLKSRRFKILGASGAALLAAYFVLSQNWAGYRPVEADWYYMRGVAYLQNGQAEEAERAFRQAWTLRPGHDRTLSSLGRVLLELNRNEEAVLRFKEALAIQPERPNVLSRYGTALARMGETSEAALVFERVLQYFPESADVHYNLGLALAQLDRIDAALPHFEIAGELEKKSQYIAAQGIALKQIGRIDESIAAFREALRQDSNNVDALNGLAWLLATQPGIAAADRESAIELAKRACGITGYRNPLFLDTLAAAYASAGRYDEAEKSARKALQLMKIDENAELVSEMSDRLNLYIGRVPYLEK